VRLDQVPVDRLVPEQRVDVLVASPLIRPVEDQVVPVPDAGQQVESQPHRESEDRQRLALRIRVYRVGQDVAGVLEQALDDVDRLPHPQGMKWLNRAM
jgi:hypothetical protein